MTKSVNRSADLLEQVLCWPTRNVAFAVLVLAALLRLPLALVDFYNHPDEVWQYLEPAYGMITGRSVVTWEYRSNMRSWLLPTLFMAPMGTGLAIAPGTILPIALPRLVSAALSLLVVLFGMLIAGRISRLHGLVAGLVLAVSTELVYFAGRTSSDALALPPFFAALWLLLDPRPRRFGRMFAAGVMLGLCFAIRFQLAPALATVAIGCCLLERRAWLPLVAGGLGGLAVDVGINALHGQAPLAWMLHNFQLNVVSNVSARYGTEPAGWYIADRWSLWGVMVIPVLALIVIGAQRFRLLFIVAVVNLAAHSFIAHKEFRFVLLSDALFLLLAAVGTAEVVQWARRRRPQLGGVILTGFGAAWFGTSAALALNDPGHDHWKANRGNVALFKVLRSRPAVCGIAYYDPITALMSHAYLQRDVPIYFFGVHAKSDLLARRVTFNVLLAPEKHAIDAATGYRRQRCFAGLQTISDCLYTRPGTCTPAPDHRFDINSVLREQQR